MPDEQITDGAVQEAAELAEKVDYSQAIENLQTSLDDIQKSVDALSDSVNASDSGAELAKSINEGVGVLGEKIDVLGASAGSATRGDVDYSSALDQVNQLICTVDLLLIVVVVLLALLCGLTFGGQLTRWMKTRG